MEHPEKVIFSKKNLTIWDGEIFKKLKLVAMLLNFRIHLRVKWVKYQFSFVGQLSCPPSVRNTLSIIRLWISSANYFNGSISLVLYGINIFSSQAKCLQSRYT